MQSEVKSSSLPLAGVRVTDLTQVWAGPYATRFLADMGAEVIKVEAIQRPDPWRMGGQGRSQLYPGFEGGDRFFDREGRSSEYNRNKLGITLDLTREAGVKLLKKLVTISDVVAENFSAGVVDRLGVGYESLRQVKPDIVMMSMPGFGSKGPEAAFRAFGPIQEAMGGVTSVTGYQGQRPLETAEYYGDPTGAAFGAAALFAALLHRKRTGHGVFIDFSQREAMTACLPEILLEHQIRGKSLEPEGNRDPKKAPHGCYRCSGPDNWLVLSVGSDDDWQALCSAMGRPELVADPRFATKTDRIEHAAALDELIEAWTLPHDHIDLMHLLQASGVAAEAVFDTAELVNDQHFRARGFIDWVDHPVSGNHMTLGVPWLLSGARAPVRMPSPMLGQHNREVLGGLLGVSNDELQSLETDGIIGDYPLSLRATG